MPRFDETGPAGAGPQTGRKMGPCDDSKDIPADHGCCSGSGFGKRFCGWFCKMFKTKTK